jgi:hypothetical protein
MVDSFNTNKRYSRIFRTTDFLSLLTAGIVVIIHRKPL